MRLSIRLLFLAIVAFAGCRRATVEPPPPHALYGATTPGQITQQSSTGAAQVQLQVPLDYSTSIVAGSGYTTIATIASGLTTNASVEAWFNVTMRGEGTSSIYQSQFSQQAIVANLAGTLTDLTGTLAGGVLATDYTQASMQSTGLPGASVKVTGSGTSWVVQCKPPAGVDVVCAVDGLQYTAQRARQPLAYLSSSSGFTPTFASPSTPVVITFSGGENLGSVTGCTIGGLACTSVGSVTDSGFVATSPAGLASPGNYTIVLACSSATACPGGYYTLLGTFAVTSGTPALTALANPLIAPATGGGLPYVLQGTDMLGITSVHVGSAVVTPTSTTSTSATFVMPANTASATPYSIQAFLGLTGSNVLSNAVYYLPTSIAHAWYAGEGFNAGTGAWTDVVSGVTTTLAVGGLPTLNQTWKNGNPAIVFSGANCVKGSYTALTMPNSVYLVADNTNPSPVSLNQTAYSSNDPVNGWVGDYSSGNSWVYTTQIDYYAHALSMSTPHLIESNYNGASSYARFDNSTALTGAITAGPTMPGVTIACNNTQSGGFFEGDIALLAMSSAGTPSSGDDAILHSIAVALWATP